MSEPKPRRTRGVFADQPKSELVQWKHGAPLETSDPENDEARAFLLPRRLEEAGYVNLAKAFDELFEIDVGRTSTRAALLIAGHMAGPSLRFAGRPARRSSLPSGFDSAFTSALNRIRAGEDRNDAARAVTAQFYKGGKSPGHGWPATPKAFREKLNRELRKSSGD